MDFHHYSLIAFQTKCHARIYGCSGLYFLISTRLVCCGFPFASGEGRRVVSVFTHPPWSILSPDILGSCQASLAHSANSRRMRGVTLAGSRTSPRWLTPHHIAVGNPTFLCIYRVDPHLLTAGCLQDINVAVGRVSTGFVMETKQLQWEGSTFRGVPAFKG